jgi:hypothetical protein
VLTCSLVFGAILGTVVGVKVIVLITGLWLLVVLASSAFLSAGEIVSWVAAGIVLQCGYFFGLLIRAFVKPSDRTIFTCANWLRASRVEPPASENDAS